MFIATADPTTLASSERNVTHPIIFRSYGACPIMWGPIVYKHFVPSGLRPCSSKLPCYHGQEQPTNGALPGFKRRVSSMVVKCRQRQTPMSYYGLEDDPRLRTRLFILRSQNGYLD